MKFSVQEIVDNIVKLENIDTREVIYIDTYLLPDSITENDIIVKTGDDSYEISNEIKEERVKTIEDKMRALRGE